MPALRTAGFALMSSILLAGSAIGSAQSLVDYMNGTGRDPRLEARRQLWMSYRPSEGYRGTAEQNTALLGALKIYDAAPRLTLATDHVARGGAVRARVGGKGHVLIESELRGQSFEGQGGQSTDLGRAARAGVFELRSSDGRHDYRTLLWLVPAADGFDLVLADAASTSPRPDPRPGITPPPEVEPLLAKFIEGVDAEILQKALEQALPAWVGENVAAVGETVMVCSIGGPLPCAVAGGANVLDFTATLCRKMVPLVKTLTDDERRALDGYFLYANLGIQFGASAGKMSRLCQIAKTGLTGADSLLAEVRNPNVRLVARMFIQEGRKITFLFCEAPR